MTIGIYECRNCGVLIRGSKRHNDAPTRECPACEANTTDPYSPPNKDIVGWERIGTLNSDQ